MIIIGLSGKKLVGKNTVAKLIAELTPLKCQEIAFADALKDDITKLCGVTLEYLEEHKPHFRLMLQGYGTDFKRQLVDKEFWVKRLEQKIKELIHHGVIDIAIVTDVRFTNEYNFLNKLGGVLVRIARPIQFSDDHHLSEESLDKLDKWHFIILNNGTVEDLRVQVKELLTKINVRIKDNK